MGDELRQCIVCGELKPLNTTYFGRSNHRFRNQCRGCKNAKRREWDEAHPEAIRAKWQRQNLKRSLAGPKWTDADVERMRKEQRDRCFYCRVRLAGGGEVDHKESLDRGGTNDPANLVLACLPCNRQKGPRDVEEFTRWLKADGRRVRSVR